MLKLTQQQVVDLKPCSLSKIPNFGRFKSLSAKQALNLGVSIEDLLWVAGRIGRKDLCVQFALECAQRVVHYNSDLRVQAALDATQKWLDKPNETNTRAAEAAGAAARAAEAAAWAAGAAWAAEAARAAAEAAWAAGAAWAAAWAAGAAWAAEAARAAAEAARAAAEAARAAAEAVEIEEQRKIFIRISS